VGGTRLATYQAIATGIAKMRRMTFQFGSEFEANQRVDPLFERAMDALVGRTPALVTIKPQTRYETRLAALSR
jgi:hypothetical protein